MKRKNRMPKYTIVNVQEDVVFNKYLRNLGAQALQAIVSRKLNIPEGCLRFNALIEYKGREQTLGVYATDELGAWARVPAELKRQWDMFRKKDRYGRPKWKT